MENPDLSAMVGALVAPWLRRLAATPEGREALRGVSALVAGLLDEAAGEPSARIEFPEAGRDERPPAATPGAPDFAPAPGLDDPEEPEFAEPVIGEEDDVPLRLADAPVVPVRVRGGAGDHQAARAAANGPAVPAPARPAQAAPIRTEAPMPDLGAIAARARLKAEGCRWAIERQRWKGTEQGRDERNSRLVDQAKKIGAYLWMLEFEDVVPDDATLGVLAACYRNVEAAAELMRDVDEADSDAANDPRGPIGMLAEAQSALRVALAACGAGLDREQEDAFRWLRRRTEEHQVFLREHMSLHRPADPARWRDLEDRLLKARETFDAGRARDRRQLNLLSKVRYESGQLAKAADPEEVLAHWRTLSRAVDELIGSGTPPSHLEIRNMLLPIVETMPDAFEPAPGLERVLVEIDRYLAVKEAAGQDSDGERERVPSDAVRRVAALLRGRDAVLIGGHCRTRAKAALEQAFGLNQLRWTTTSPHESLRVFEADIARPETAVVILAIRWSSHSFEGVRKFCEEYNKPFVRLPAGYGPNQVAVQILEQVSGRLEAGAGARG